ncbi:MAG: primosomal protein DnaI [Streptococcaceae bacterium]|jgi:primosomal protein DnaI|nr:primosomal protein DnaI [Streptococcaceae bacterium]MCH4177975.1 primosomal protein DnaI [Streptococcaceae bacterium]
MDEIQKSFEHLTAKIPNWQEKYHEVIRNKVLSDQEIQLFIASNQLTEQEVENSFSKLYEYVIERDKFINQDENRVAVGYQPKLVLNHHYVDVSYEPTLDLIEQRKTAELKNRIMTLHLPATLKNVDFSDIERTPERREILNAILDFVEGYAQAPKVFHKGIYLYGTFGVGKTYLMASLANELSKREHSTLLVHFPTFAQKIKSAIKEDKVDVQITELNQAEILVLDDIGAENGSAWIRDEVLQPILTHRMQENLPTFFTSNLNMDELELKLAHAARGQEELWPAKRVMERIHYLSKEIYLMGDNRRESNY